MFLPFLFVCLKFGFYTFLVTAAMRSTPPQQRSSMPPQMNNFPMENGMPSEASIMASFSNRSPVASSSERNFSSQPAPPPPAQMR